MSLEEMNKAMVRRYFDEIMNKGNPEAIDEMIAPECVFTIPTLPEPFYGPDGYRQLIELLRSAFPDLLFKVEDELAEGDIVVDRWTASGTSKGPFNGMPPSGQPFEIEGIGWYRLRDGKFIENRVNEDSLGLLQQIGALADSDQQSSQTGKDIMSPEENKIIARRFFEEVWNKSNDSVVDLYLAPDFIEHFPGMEGGHEGFLKTAKLFRTAFPDINLDIEDEIAAGDKVVHRWTWRCTHKGPLYGVPPTGNKLQFSGMTIVRLADGQIVERWASLDELGMLQQMGAIPRH